MVFLFLSCGTVAALPDALVQTFSLSTFGGETFSSHSADHSRRVFGVIGAIVFERGQLLTPCNTPRRWLGGECTVGNPRFSIEGEHCRCDPTILPHSFSCFRTSVMARFSFVQWMQVNLPPGEMFYNVTYVALIIFFCYFYTAVTFNPVDVADIAKSGVYSGYRAGKKTAEWIDTA